MAKPVSISGVALSGSWLLTACLLLACNSCVSTQPLNYSVSVISESDETIRLEPFDLFKGENSLVAVGNVMPGGHASCGSCFNKPQRDITLRWKSLKTGKTGQAGVVVELPKAFTRKNGAEIYFHVNPTEQKAWVTYGVLDASGELREIK